MESRQPRKDRDKQMLREPTGTVVVGVANFDSAAMEAQMNQRQAGYALLRITMGVVFLSYGIGKFMGGLANFVGGMNQTLCRKATGITVIPFAYFLPFAEVTAGALILFGLFTRIGLHLSGS